MKTRNKKIFCFFLLMFITLISCCIVAASDNVANNTTTTHKTVITEKNNYEVSNIQTTKALAQSDDNIIEETDDQNVVKREKNNAKAKINKVSNITQKAVKGATKTVSSWDQIDLNGTNLLTCNITAGAVKNIAKNFTLDGQGFTIIGDSNTGTTLFNCNVPNNTTITILNVNFENISAQPIYFKSSLSSQAIANCNLIIRNCTFNNINPTQYASICVYCVDGEHANFHNYLHISITDCEFNNCNKSDIYISGGRTYLTVTNIIDNGRDLNKWDMGNDGNHKIRSSSSAKMRMCSVDVNDGFVNADTQIKFTLFNETYFNNGGVWGNNITPSANAPVTYSLTNSLGEYMVDSSGHVIHDHPGTTNKNGSYEINLTINERGIYYLTYSFPGENDYLPVYGYKEIVIQDALRYEVPETISKYVGEPLDLTVNINDPDGGRYTSEDWYQGIGYDTNPSSNASHYRYYLDTGVEDENYFTRYVINGVTMLNYQNTFLTDNPSIKTYPEGYYYAFDVKSQYLGSTIYVPSTNFTTNVKIMREPTCTTIQNVSGRVNGIVGENVTLKANVINTRTNSPLTQGNVTFKQGNTVLGVVRVNEGVAVLNVTFNESINDNLYAIFNDDYANEYTWLYNNSSAIADLNIEKVDTVVETTESITANYNDRITVTATVKDKSGNIVKSGVVTFKNGDTELLNVTVNSDGQANYTYTVTDSIVITSFYNGTVKYKNNSNTTTITMFTIPTILSFEDLPSNVRVAEEFSFKVKLTDIDHNPLDNQVIVVNINGNDIPVSGNTDSNGFITAHYTPINNYNIVITASYTTDHRYRSNTTRTTINSNSIRLIDTVMGIIVPESVEVSVPFTFKVNLTNSSGEAIPNKDVYVSILGESVSVSYSTAEKLYIGTYTPKDNSNIIITANTPADHVYNSSSARNDTLTTSNIGLIKTNLTLSFSQGNKVAHPVTITASLTNRSGDNLEGIVRVYINDEPVKIIDTSISNTLRYIPTDNTTLNVYAVYAGDSHKYDGNTTATYNVPVDVLDTTLVINVPGTGIKVGEAFNFNVSLTNTTGGQSIGGKNINVTVNGERVSVTYDSALSLYVGTYTPINNDALIFKANFTGDKVYKGSYDEDSSITSQNIALIDTVMGIIVPDKVDVAVPFTFNVNLTNMTGDAISGQAVTVLVNEENVNVAFNVNTGLYEGVYTPKDNTDIIISANSPDTNIYKGANAINNTLTSANINLIPTLVTLTFNENRISVNDTLSVGVCLTNGTVNGDIVSGDVLIYINDNFNRSVPITTQEVFFTLTAQDNTTLEFYAVYAGDNRVYASNTSAKYIIPVDLIGTTTKISVPDTVKVNETFNFTISLTNGTKSIPDKNIIVTVNDEIIDNVVYDSVTGLYNASYTPKYNKDDLEIKALFGGDTQYGPSEDVNTSLNRSKIILINTNIGVISPKSVNVSDILTMKFNISDEYGKKLRPSMLDVYILGELVTGEVVDDYLVISYPTTHETVLSVSVEFIDHDGIHNNSNVDFVVSVHKINTTTLVKVINNTAGNVKINVSVIGADNQNVTDGNITIIANGHPYDIIELNGQKEISVDLTDLTTYGTFPLRVQYSGNYKYEYSNGVNSTNLSEEIVNIEVIPQNVTFTVNANESVYVTEVVNITGVLKDGFGNAIANRNVIVRVIDMEGHVDPETVTTDNNGVYTRLYTTNKMGIYNVTVYYGGQDAIPSTTRQTNFTVKLIPTRTVAEIYNNTAGNFSISVNVTDNREGFTSNTVERGRIRVEVGTATVYQDVTVGENIIKLDSITNNQTVNIRVIYEANNKYNTSEASLSQINARIKDTSLVISATPTTHYNKTITINGTIHDELGNPIESTGKIRLQFNGTYSYTGDVTSDSEGRFNITVIAGEIGNFIVNASFIGIDGEYNSSNATTTFNVIKIPTDTEVLIDDESASDLRVLFRVYNDTTFVSAGNVTLYVDDTPINVTDLEARDVEYTRYNGNLYVVKHFSEEYLESYGITGGVTSIRAVYAENSIYVGSEDTYSGTLLDNGVINVTVNQSSIYVDDSVKITVNVTDLEGHPIRGILTLEINDNVTRGIVIDSTDEGIYSIIYSNTTANSYTVKATLDTAIYGTVSNTTSFNINKIPTRTNVSVHNNSWGNASIDVVVYDARTNTTISSGDLHVVIGNADKTNIDKRIVSEITNIEVETKYAGEFAISVVYLENPTYLSSNGVDNTTGDAVVINIVKHNASLSVVTDKSRYSVGENVTISGYLIDVNTGFAIADATVEVVIRNSSTTLSTYYLITDSNGYYEVNRTTSVAGTFNVNATFEGVSVASVSNVNAISNDTTYNVDRIPTITSVECLNSTYGNVTIAVNVKGNDGINITDGILTVKFGEQVIESMITGNVTVIKLPSQGIGVYDLNVSYPGSTKYVESNNTVGINNINVQKQNAVISVFVTPNSGIIVGDEVKISGYVYDGINNQTNLVNGVVNITFIDDNNDVETESNVRVTNSYYEFIRHTKYAGIIDVTVCYINDTYNNSTAKTSYTVGKIPTNTTIGIYNDTFDKVEVSVTIVDARNGNPVHAGRYNLSVNDEFISAQFGQESNWINSSTFIIPIETSDREIRVTLNYTGDATHESSIGKDENQNSVLAFESKNQTATLTIKVNSTETYVGDKININGTLIDGLNHVISGKINLTFTNGTHTDIREVEVKNGRYSYNRTVNMTGQVNVTASYLGNDTINPANVTAYYRINKLPTRVTISVVNNTVGNLTISVQVTETYHNYVLEEGNITIEYGTNIVPDAILEGSNTLFNLTSTSQAPYTIIVNYTGNISHEFSTKSVYTGLLVKQSGILTISSENNKQVDQPVKINGSFIDGMGKEYAHKEVIVHVFDPSGSNIVQIPANTDEHGKYSVTFTPNKNGTYTAESHYVGDDKVGSIITGRVSFTIDKIHTNTNVTFLNKTAGNVTIKVKVTDEYGNNITSGQVNVTVNHVNTTVTFTDTAEIIYKLSIEENGTHDVRVYYLGTPDKYYPSNGKIFEDGTAQELTEVTVELQQSSITINKNAQHVYVSDNITVYGNLVDGMGYAIPNAIVNITFVDENNDIVRVHNITDSDGYYSYYRTTEYNGTINVTATYYGEPNRINASNATISYLVEKIDTLTYINPVNNTLGNVTIETWFINQLDISEYIREGTFDVFINQEETPYKSFDLSQLEPNEKGRYTIKLEEDFNVGENTVIVRYNGNYKYKPSHKDYTDRLYKDDIIINITLDEDNTFVDNLINVNVSMTHNNLPVEGRVNISIYNSSGDVVKIISVDEYLSNGNKSFTFTNDTSDTYTIKVVFDGTSIYNPLNATKMFTLNRLPTETLVDVVSNIIGNVTISVKVNDTINNAMVTSGVLLVTVDGKAHELNPISVNSSGITIIKLDTTGTDVMVSVRYLENNKYNGSHGVNATDHQELKDIILSKQPTNITVEANPNETYIGTPITISGRLINPLGDVNNQIVHIIINNTLYTVHTSDDNTGSYTFTYDGQTSIYNGNGTFIISVSYDPNTNLDANASHNSTTIKVDKIPTNSSIEVLNNTLGNVTVNVKVVNATNGGAVTQGTVEFYDKNGQVIGRYPITTAENIIKLESITTSGNILVTAKYLENNIYLASNVKDKFDNTEDFKNITVANKTATILLDVEEGPFVIGDSVTINGSLVDSTGNVVDGENIIDIRIDNDVYHVNVTGGKFSLINITYTQGVKKVNATFIGSNSIDPAVSISKEFMVNLIPSRTIVGIMNTTVGSVVLDINVTDTVNNVLVTEGTLSIKVGNNNSRQVSVNSSGITYVHLSEITSMDNVTVTVTYLSNDKYDTSTGIDERTINLPDPKEYIDINTTRHNSIMEVIIVESPVKVGQNITIRGTLLVDNGTKVDNGTTGDNEIVEIWIGNTRVGTATVKDGLFEYNYTTNQVTSGKVATIRYNGTELVRPSEAEVTYVVEKLPTITLISVLNNTAGNVTLKISVNDSFNNKELNYYDGNNVALGNLTIYVGSNNVKNVTVSDSNIVTLPSLTEPQPNVRVTVIFTPRDDSVRYLESQNYTIFSVVSQVANLSIKANPNPAYVGDVVTISGRLTDGMNNNISNVELSYSIGTTYDRTTTDENGTYHFTYTPTHEGIYEINVSYAGGGAVRAIRESIDLIVNKIPTSTKVKVLNTEVENVTISVNVTDNQNNPVINGKINVTIENSTWTSTSTYNITGTSTEVKIILDRADSDYTVKVLYLGDEKYINSTGLDDQGRSNIPLHTIKDNASLVVTATPSEAYVGRTVEISIFLKDDMNNGITDKISLNFTSEEGSEIVENVQVINGYVVYNRTSHLAGHVNVTAMYHGNDTINPVNATTNYTIIKIPTSTTLVRMINNTIGHVTIELRFADSHTGNAITSGSNFTVELVGHPESRVNYNLDEDSSDDRFNITSSNTVILKIDESHYDEHEKIPNSILTFQGNGTYNSSWLLLEEELVKANVIIDLKANESVFINQTVQFNVTVKDGEGNPFDAVVNITLDDELFAENVEIPVTGHEFSFTKEEMGNHTIKVIYPGNELLSYATTNKTVKVDRIPTETKVTLLNNTYGNVTIKVVVNDTIYNKFVTNGTLIITGGYPCNVTLNGTETVIKLDITHVRNTNVYVRFNGSAYYQPSYGIDSESGEEFEAIDVVRQDATLSIDVQPNPNHVGNVSYITGKLTDGLGNNVTNEVVSILVNNVTYMDEVSLNSSGEFNISYTGSLNGTYNISVMFGGNRFIKSASSNATLTLNKVETSTLVTLLNDSAGNVTIRVNVTDEFGSPVTGESFAVNITDEDGMLTELIVPINGISTDVLLPVDSSGDYKVNVTYLGTNRFKESKGLNESGEQFTNIKVGKQDVNLTVGVIRTEVYVGTNMIIQGELRNASGFPISHATINLTFNGEESVNVTTNDAGYYSYTRPTHVNGNVTVKAYYNGSDKYNNAVTNTSYLVNKIPTNTTVTIVNNTVANVTIDVQVINAIDPLVIITNGTLNVTVNKVTTQYNITGSVTSIKLNITNCSIANVSVVYTGNDTYANSTGIDRDSLASESPVEFKEINVIKQNATLTIVEGPNPVYVHNNVTYEGILLDGLGNNITGKINITVIHLGEVIAFIENVDVVDGKYSVNRTTKVVGLINVTASYLGNSTLNPVNASTEYVIELRPTVTLVNITNNTAGNVTIDVQVRDANGTALTSGNFTVKVQDQPDTIVKIKGSITPVKLNLTSASQYVAVSVIYEGNDIYAASIGMDMDKYLDEPSQNDTLTNIVVEYQTPIMTINPIADSNVGDTIVISGHIEDGMGNNITNRNITVHIGQIELSNLTEVNGNYTVYFTSTINGTFTAIAAYNGNNSVSPINVNTTFKVTKLKTTTIVEVLNRTAGNVTISVNVTDERGNAVNHGEFNITIDGTPSSYIIMDDITTVKLDVEENSTISINVTYLGDNQYESSKAQQVDEISGELVDFNELTIVKQDVNLTVGVIRHEIPIGTLMVISGYLTNSSQLPIANANITLTFGNVDKVNVTTDSNGHYTYERDTSIAGFVEVDAYYNGSAKYNNITAKTHYTVYKLPTNTTVNVLNNTSGNVIIDVVVYDMYHKGIIIGNGTLNVTVNNKSSIIPFTTENTTIKLDIKNMNKANVTVEYMGNDTYLNSSGITLASWNTDSPVILEEIELVKQTASLTLLLNDTNLIVFEPVKFNGTFINGLGKYINTNVSIIVDNGTDRYIYENVEVKSGYYEQERITELTGTINVTVVFAGDDNINPINITKSYVVDKRETITLVEVVNDTVGNIVIDVVVKDAVDNKTLTEGKDLIALSISEGIFHYSIDGDVTRIRLPVNDNRQLVRITVDYLGNGTYKPSLAYDNSTYTEDYHETITVINVKTHNSTLSVDVTPVNSTVGTTYNISGYFRDINTTAIVDAGLTINVNGTNFYFTTVEDGYYSINYTSNHEGNYTVTVSYGGDEVIGAKNNSTTFKANKIPTNTTVYIVNNTIGNITLNVTVTDNIGNPVNGTLNVTVGTVTKQVTVTGGEVLLDLESIGLGIDTTEEVTARVVFLGNDTYLNSTGIDGRTLSDEIPAEFGHITSDKAYSIIGVDVDPVDSIIGNRYILYGSLNDTDGFAIKNAEVNITVMNDNGIVYSVNVTTDRFGEFIYANNTLTAGMYVVNVSYISSKYNYTSAEKTFTISKVNTSTEVRVLNTTSGNVTVRVIVNDVEGRPVTDGFVNITDMDANVLGRGQLSGKNYVDILLGSILSSGSVKLIANYEGTYKYANSTSHDIVELLVVKQDAVITLDVNDSSVTVFDSIKFNGSLVDGLGNNINDKVNITVTNGSDSYTIVGLPVDDGYYEHISITNLTGALNVTVSYAGNESVNPLNITKMYSVDKRETVTLVQIVNDSVGNLVIDAVVIDAVDSSTLTSGDNLIRIIYDEGSFTKSIDVSGVTRINVPVSENIRFVSIKVEYLGNGTYEPSTGYDNRTYPEENKTFSNVELKLHNATLSVNVNPTISRVANTYNISGYLNDMNGTAISNAKIIVSVNNSYYNDSVTTDQNGYYSVNFTPETEGNYTVNVKFNSNGVVNTTVNSTTLRADKVPTNTYVRIVNNTLGNVTLAINVTETDGTSITRGLLNISVGDNTAQYIITNAENIISLKDLGLNIDSTTPVNINIFYPGTNVYINSTGKDADTQNEFNKISADKANAIISVKVEPNTVTIGKAYDIFGNLTNSYGDPISNAKVNITVKDSQGIVYTLNVTTNNRGVFNYINNSLPANIYTVNVSFISADYEYTSDEATFTVDKMKTTTSVVILNRTAGNVTVRVIVNDAEGRPVTNGFVNITDTHANILERGQLNGKNYADILIRSIKTNDKISLIVNYEGTLKYKDSTNDTALKSFTINTRDVTIKVNPENTTHDNTSVKIKITDTTTGKALENTTFNITDADGNYITTATTTEDGTVTVNLTLPVGLNELEVVYPGNETYSAHTESFTLNVNKRPSKTSAEIVNNTANNVKVKVIVTDANTGKTITNGNVTISVDGRNLAKGILGSDGRVIINVPISSAGRYNFVATFEGNTNYTDSFDTIGKKDVLPRETKVTANVPNKTVGDTILDITLKDSVTNKGLTDNVIVSLPDGETINVKVNNGVASIPVNLKVGNNNIKVSYPGNETYASSQTNIPVTVVKRNTTTTAKITNNTAGNVTVQAKVTDTITGRAVVSGNVAVIANNKVVGKGTLDKNGVATIKTNITNTGNYNIITKYEENSNYTSSNASNNNVKVTSRKANVTAQVTDDTFDETKVEITISDKVTNAPLDADVIVKLPDGTQIPATTKDGKVVVPVDLPVGNSTIIVDYPGDKTYDGEVTKITVNIKKRPSSTRAAIENNVAGDVVIKATVKDKLDDKAVTNGKVKVYVNGSMVGQANLNNKGVATINTNVRKVGNYTFNIKFDGNNNYTQSSTKLNGKVVARDINVKVSVENDKVTNTSLLVNVTDSSTGKGVANETVSVRLPNGTTIRVTTDKNGIAHAKTSLPSGTNTLKVTVKANDQYESASKTVKVNVQKINVKVVVDSVSGVVGEKITLTAHITDEYGAPVSGGNLVFKLNGRTLRMDGRFDTNDTDPMKISVKKGIVTFTMKADLYLRAGKNITASYSGSSKYNSAKGNVAEANIKKRMAQISVSVSPTLVKQDKNIVFTAKLKDVTSGSSKSLVSSNDAYVMFKINGKTLRDSNGEVMKVKVVKNQAKYTYHIPLGTSGMVNGHLRDYMVTAVYANPDFYPDSRDTVRYNVQRSATSIVINSATVKSGKLSIKAKIIDEYKYNVVGKNKVTVKINGKTYKIKNKTAVFTVNNGVINLSGINIGDNKVKSLTIVTGERQPYYESEVTTKNVKTL